MPIGTYPHADHIGGIPAVMENFEIGKFYMPKVTTTTKTFENVLRAAKAKGLSINVAKAGVTLDLGEGVKAEMLAPNSSHYDDLNNYSAVIKVTYGNTAFLFTGNAEKESEQEMLDRGYDLKADVLKVGHHGSSSATTWAFLKAVSPKYAVISCGKGNDYGHPHKETMEKLKSLGVIVYRTDECGTVVTVSDGKTISFNVKPGDYTAGSSGTNGTSNTSSSKTFQSLTIRGVSLLLGISAILISSSDEIKGLIILLISVFAVMWGAGRIGLVEKQKGEHMHIN